MENIDNTIPEGIELTGECINCEAEGTCADGQKKVAELLNTEMPEEMEA